MSQPTIVEATESSFAGAHADIVKIITNYMETLDVDDDAVPFMKKTYIDTALAVFHVLLDENGVNKIIRFIESEVASVVVLKPAQIQAYAGRELGSNFSTPDTSRSPRGRSGARGSTQDIPRDEAGNGSLGTDGDNIPGIGTEGNNPGIGTEGINNPGTEGNNPGTEGNNPGIGTEGNNPGIDSEGSNPDTEGNNPGIGTEGNNPGIGTEGNNPGIGTEGNNPGIGIEGNNPGTGGNNPGTEGNNPGIGIFGNTPGIASEGDNPGFGANNPGIGAGMGQWRTGGGPYQALRRARLGVTQNPRSAEVREVLPIADTVYGKKLECKRKKQGHHGEYRQNCLTEDQGFLAAKQALMITQTGASERALDDQIEKHNKKRKTAQAKASFQRLAERMTPEQMEELVSGATASSSGD